jgi:hypothetical protein
MSIRISTGITVYSGESNLTRRPEGVLWERESSGFITFDWCDAALLPIPRKLMKPTKRAKISTKKNTMRETVITFI